LRAEPRGISVALSFYGPAEKLRLGGHSNFDIPQSGMADVAVVEGNRGALPQSNAFFKIAI